MDKLGCHADLSTFCCEIQHAWERSKKAERNQGIIWEVRPRTCLLNAKVRPARQVYACKHNCPTEYISHFRRQILNNLVGFPDIC